MNGLMDAKLIQLQELIEDICHELRTPLTTILGEIDVAFRMPEIDQEHYYDTLKVIRSVSRDMDKMLKDLLFIARTESGQMDYEMHPIYLPDLMKDLLSQTKSMAKLKNIDLHMVCNTPYHIHGDYARLRQLFTLLLHNAVKYTGTDGMITVHSVKDLLHTTIKIADTGIGIADEKISHLFERFYQANCNTSEDDNGSGLGLAIANSIVKAHDGEIKVESILGKGSCFSVSFLNNPPDKSYESFIN